MIYGTSITSNVVHLREIESVTFIEIYPSYLVTFTPLSIMKTAHLDILRNMLDDLDPSRTNRRHGHDMAAEKKDNLYANRDGSTIEH